jgi:molecular chaperone HtpG
MKENSKHKPATDSIIKPSLFQVDLSGILKVLSDNLYSSREIFLRELLQNAVDAINARKHLEKFKPLVRVEYFSEGSNSGIIFTDNGIGLTASEMEEFLSKIGASSKSMEEISERRNDYIGQFGIGMLSCFMVSDEITVISKSVKSEKTVRWVGNINGSYTTSDTNHEMERGTRVILKLRDNSIIDRDNLTTYTTRYGEYLKIPIELDINGETCMIGKSFPWEGKSDGTDILNRGEEIFGEEFRHYIPIEDKTKKTKGIAYILPRPTHHGAAQTNRVYIKNMLVTTKAHDFLPEWAFFVKAIVNSSNLTPTASRENIYSNKTAEDVKEQLGDNIKDYFRDLAKSLPQVLEEILNTHSNALKSIALSDEQFLKFIYTWFRFPTSQGELSLNDIRKRTKTVLYISDLDQFRQVIPIATANNTLIVNAGYIYDSDLLDSIAQIDTKTIYQKIDAQYFGNILSDLSIADFDQWKKRLADLQNYLTGFGCELLIKQFVPIEIPAIFHLSYEKQIERDIHDIREESDSLWASISEGVYESSADAFKSKLFLNFKNPIVKRLLKNKKTDLDRALIELLYANAMMLGHYPLNNEEMRSLNKNMIFMIENML